MVVKIEKSFQKGEGDNCGVVSKMFCHWNLVSKSSCQRNDLLAKCVVSELVCPVTLL